MKPKGKHLRQSQVYAMYQEGRRMDIIVQRVEQKLVAIEVWVFHMKTH